MIRSLLSCLLMLQVLLFSLQVATVQARADAATEYQIQTFPLERNGIALHLQRLAVAGTQPQRQILLVHGLTYSSHEFDVNYADYSLARYLAARGFAVWTFDVAGYGDSQEVEDGFMPNSDYAAEDAAAAAAEILKVSGQKKLDVLGWSWGTVTSSRFVARHPEMVKKLVLYAPIMVGLGAAEVKVPFNHNTWLHAAGDFQTTKDGAIDYSIVDPQVVAVFQSNCWRYDKDSSPNRGDAPHRSRFHPGAHPGHRRGQGPVPEPRQHARRHGQAAFRLQAGDHARRRPCHDDGKALLQGIPPEGGGVPGTLARTASGRASRLDGNVPS